MTIGSGARGMFRPASWRVLFATGVMFFAVALGFLAFDLRPQAAVAMASALLTAFFAGYTYRAWVHQQEDPPPLGSLSLQGDTWPSEDDGR